MRVDFNLVRALIARAANDAPFEVSPVLPEIDFDNGPMITIKTPVSEGDEYFHWRWIFEEKLIRMTTNGRPGMGKMESRVEGLTARGTKFFECSRNDEAWNRAMSHCEMAQALTLESLMRELRTETSRRLKATRAKDAIDA